MNEQEITSRTLQKPKRLDGVIMQFPTIDNSTASESNPSTELSDIETNPKFSHWKNLQKGERYGVKCVHFFNDT